MADDDGRKEDERRRMLNVAKFTALIGALAALVRAIADLIG